MREQLVELLGQVKAGTISHGGIAGRLEQIIKEIDLKAQKQEKQPAAEK